MKYTEGDVEVKIRPYIKFEKQHYCITVTNLYQQKVRIFDPTIIHKSTGYYDAKQIISPSLIPNWVHDVFCAGILSKTQMASITAYIKKMVILYEGV